MTEISLIVTLNNQFTITIYHFNGKGDRGYKREIQATESLEGHFSYYLQLICYSLIVITYLLMLT